MGGISPIGGSGNLPYEPKPETSNKIPNQIDAIDSFSNLIEQFAMLAMKAKEGGHGHG
ncbi:MAG: hypothetical protein KDK71_04190 [Chlamydiia bacterium]|nr:hypothetical protein [Chlamydiia bacterium]